MGWADRYIENLKAGRVVTFRPRGRSMEGKISDGQLVTCEPMHGRIPAVGDIVLCTVKGSQYLHLVKSVSGGQALIGNNHGNVNGWCRFDQIHGVYIPSKAGAGK